MAKYEYELCALEGTGLPDVELDAALTHLLGFVQTCARMGADDRAAQQDSAMTDEQWWAANADLLARVFDAERYPVAARVGAAMRRGARRRVQRGPRVRLRPGPSAGRVRGADRGAVATRRGGESVDRSVDSGRLR